MDWYGDNKLGKQKKFKSFCNRFLSWIHNKHAKLFIFFETPKATNGFNCTMYHNVTQKLCFFWLFYFSSVLDSTQVRVVPQKKDFSFGCHEWSQCHNSALLACAEHSLECQWELCIHMKMKLQEMAFVMWPWEEKLVLK